VSLRIGKGLGIFFPEPRHNKNKNNNGTVLHDTGRFTSKNREKDLYVFPKPWHNKNNNVIKI
jgi:hypothetical protein